MTARFALGLAIVLLLAAGFRLLWLERLPPGLHYDEAAYGLQALELLRHPRLEVFFPAFTGREPLFVYVAAGALGVLGPSVFALRLVAAVVGIGAVATTAIAGRALFGPAVGLMGSGLLAVSFWHVLISRMAYRAGLLALLTPLAIWLLWRAWSRPSLARGIVAGAVFGLLAYTYVAVRLLPVALTTFFVAELALGPLRDRRRALAFAGFALTALIVAGPLLHYFYWHPQDFAVRFAQTATIVGGETGGPSTLWQGIVDTFGLYGFRGDVLQKYNLPLRPGLEPPLAVLFAVGLLHLVVGWRSSANRLALAWTVGALAPGFITSDSPNFLRLVGAAPPSYLIAAVGAVTLARWAPWPRLVPAAGVALLLVQAGWTYRDYFHHWAPSADTYYALHGDLADLGNLAAAQPPGPILYAASEHYRHPTVAYTAGGAFDRLKWFDGRSALVLPPAGVAARYLVPRSAVPPDLTPLGEPIATRDDPTGQPAVSLFAPEPRSADPAPSRGFWDDRFGRVAGLAQVGQPGHGRAGEPLRVVTTWLLEADAPGAAYDVFVHALDAHGRRWGQRDVSPYLAPEWRAGETLVVWLDVPLDPTAPPGPYHLRLGLNDPARGRALEPRRRDGAPVPSAVDLPPIPIQHGAERTASDLIAAFQRDTPGATVHGTEMGPVTLLASNVPDRLRPGDVAWVDLLWQARGDEPTGTAELFLLGDGGAVRTLSKQDLGALDPWRLWRVGEPVRDVRRIEPARDDVGRWTVVVGVRGQEHALGQIDVEAPPTSYALPTPERTTDATFGGVARLLGLDVAPAQVVLYWQAAAPADRNYTVFVHALASDGRILAQHDGQPAAGARPTRGWARGEVIRDEHPLALPPDTTQLAIGLYDATTGRRLLLDRRGDDRLVVELR